MSLDPRRGLVAVPAPDVRHAQLRRLRLGAFDLQSRRRGAHDPPHRVTLVPGGLGEYVASADEFLVFEDGPSVEVRLQWVSYRDASDQCSLSRIWGGIHPPADDIPGRLIGLVVGPQAWDHANTYFGAVDCPADLNGDGVVDGQDLGAILADWGCVGTCDADLDGNLLVDGADLGQFFAAFGGDC